MRVGGDEEMDLRVDNEGRSTGVGELEEIVCKKFCDGGGPASLEEHQGIQKFAITEDIPVRGATPFGVDELHKWGMVEHAPPVGTAGSGAVGWIPGFSCFEEFSLW